MSSDGWSNGLAQQLGALSPEQREHLAKRLSSLGLATLAPRTIPPRVPGEPIPLSFAQQRLWFLHRLEPTSSAYHIPLALRLAGPLDVTALHRTLDAILTRHESLRTRIVDAEGGPVQVVEPSRSIALPLIDVGTVAEQERDAEAQRLARQEARAPFDLGRGPLLRARLLRFAEQDHLLLLTMHHIASDGWSVAVLMKELGTLYDSFVTGVPAALPELPVQYPDYAAWQRRRLETDVLERELRYWTERLAGAPAVLELPTDRPRPAVSSHRAVSASLLLPRSLSADLQALNRREGLTPFMTQLAAFKILLARYCGHDDIVIGTPIAGRSHVELEGLIGCFLNTLVLRTDLSGAPTFRQLLARVRETSVGAYAHQELPFERLVEELQPARSLSHNPLFQVLFQAGNMPRETVAMHGLEARRVGNGGIGSKFDLSFRIRERSGSLACICAGDADMFDLPTLEHLLEQYSVLLQQIVAAPDSSIAAYTLVTEGVGAMLPDPRQRLAQPARPLVTDAIRRVAAEASSRTAIEQGGRCWSYGDLAAGVEALGDGLDRLGLPHGAVVALTGRSSVGLVTAMVAILSRGWVLLPIAADLPEHRKRLMVRESGAKLLLPIGDEDTGWAGDLGLEARVRVCEQTGRVDERALEGRGAAPERPSRPGPDDPAYIFFTSGTTGTPKGVLGVHKGVSHFLAWQHEEFGVGPTDRCAQLTNISFDVVLRDILMPLWSGATLCLPPSDLPPDRVLAWLAAEGITVVHAVPSLTQAWLSQARPEVSLPALRWVFSAGEPLTDALVRRWRGVAERCGIVNLYGPTETTMVKCFYRVPPAVEPGVQPVGASLPDSQALVLAGDNRLCGVNEMGEVVLRTPFRTRGYVNAPEAQARHFVPNPFGSDPDDVLYRTGDLGRWRPDGNLIVLARLDHQIKIRGVRIEPDEVTAVLSQHPSVIACAVLGVVSDGSEPALVAYVVARSDAAQPAPLRAFLAERLPPALVPSGFVFLDQLPLTPNGKLDRRALPPPGPSSAVADRPYLAPRTPIERMLADMWAEVLRVPRVGVQDDFFALGGHSLRATQVVARVRAALRIELPLRAFFETPTVGGLALTVAQRLLEASEVRQ